MVTQIFDSKTYLNQDNLLAQALAEGLSLALWKLPNQSRQHLIIDFNETPSEQKIDLEENKSGFAISPFINPESNHTLLIESHLHYTWDKEEVKVFESTLNFNQKQKKDFFLENIVKKNNSNHLSAFLPADDGDVSGMFDSKNHYLNLVKDGIAKIHLGEFQKVVLSRRKEIQLQEDFNISETFQSLCKAYPNAFVYFFSIPEVGTWMGASPETLISVDEHQIFRTIALAGTQAYQPEIQVNQFAWNQKEIEEQAMVSRYIINCFKKIRLREYIEEGPKSMVAGNLIHLRTNYTVDMKATNFPQLGTVMLELLHPTSAVCGMPKEPALQFILENEGYQRSFYSGFLGPINIERESHLFVNLRCMQLFSKKAILYAGAGITEDSIPEKEWNETEMKCNTLLQVIQKNVSL